MRHTALRIIYLIANVLGMGLNVYFLIDDLIHPTGSEGFFLAFCFLLGLVFFVFCFVLTLKSFKHGTYYLNELFYDEDGQMAVVPLIVVIALSIIALFFFVWDGLSLLGVNHYWDTIDLAPRQLIFSTAWMLLENGALGLAYDLTFRYAPKDLR
jgi:hypothetical protein